MFHTSDVEQKAALPVKTVLERGRERRMTVCTHVITRARHYHSSSCMDTGDFYSPIDEDMDGIQRVPFCVRYPPRKRDGPGD